MPNPTSAHGQPVADPIAHFKAIPWCAKLLSDKSVVQVTVPDRTPIASTESTLVRETLNTSSTVRACITFFRYIKPTIPAAETGEEKSNPFLELCTLVDLNTGLNGYATTAHGGFLAVALDEVMGTAANLQADNFNMLECPLTAKKAQGAFTASLKLDFKRPVYTPSVALVRGKVLKKEGRRLSVKGSFEDSDGKVLATAEGLWVMVNRDIGRWTDAKL